MLLSQMVDISEKQVIRGAKYPPIGLPALLHTTATQDTLHINAKGVA